MMRSRLGAAPAAPIRFCWRGKPCGLERRAAYWWWSKGIWRGGPVRAPWVAVIVVGVGPVSRCVGFSDEPTPVASDDDLSVQMRRRQTTKRTTAEKTMLTTMMMAMMTGTNAASNREPVSFSWLAPFESATRQIKDASIYSCLQ